MNAAAFEARFSVSRETVDRMEVYAALLQKWSPKINLVARSTLDSLWERHFHDSAQLFDLAPENAENWVDLGSGGGFPGAVIAILAAEKRPHLHLTCVESDQRKAVFLRTVFRETGVSAKVQSARIEEIHPQEADVLSARALAPLDDLLSHAQRHLSPGGTALFLKGAEHATEVKEALETWTFQVDTIQSETNPNAVILKMREIRRV